jgi:hypothetical protein
VKRILFLGALAFLNTAGRAFAQTPADVPSGHWARAAVRDVLATGVMTAENGKFRGNSKVSRRELAITIARLAQSLEKGDWANKPAAAIKADSAVKKEEAVTRYVMASVINKVARIAAPGLPKPTGKAYQVSVAFQKIPDIAVPKTDPAYDSLVYLSKNRMLLPKSVILKSGPEPVTAKDLSQALTIMIAGLNDRLTDEPQNRDEIPHPPGHKH